MTAAVPACLPQAHRYFFALLPDAVTANRIHAFADQQLGEQGLHPAERLHMTLAITQDFAVPQPVLVEALERAARSVAATPFELALESMNVGRYSVALRPKGSVKPLRALQAEIARAMRREHVAMREGFEFSPHVTVRYRGGELVQRPIERLCWRANSFVLLESLVGLGRYVRIGNWPMYPPPERQGSLFAV